MQFTNVRLPVHLCLVSLSLLCGPVAAPCLAGQLQAGLARIDITPIEPVMLAGYASRKELSHGVHDPLFARAIAFDMSEAIYLALTNEAWMGGSVSLLKVSKFKFE